jgi:circadian clock protein KaiC
MVRKMEVMKMRGQATLAGLHTFRIGQAGIEVFAPAARSASALPAPRVAGDAPRLSMGIDVLDDMLGGGLPRGYSLLVAGPSGSGKSILAAAFLAAGARRGEAGVIAAFEQRTDRGRDPELGRMIASGQVAVIDTTAPDLSIDEVVLLLLTGIRRAKATRVVIDSLSGFELSLAPTFRDDFRESMSRLVGALAAEGVTVLMTSELEDRYTDLRFSPYGTAFLTDAIIVQRYIELESRLRRVIAVVKVRASAHSDELREFHIDEGGIRIGAILREQEGLLGGRPTRRRRQPTVTEGADDG